MRYFFKRGLIYIDNLIRVFFLKVKSGNKLQISWKQLFSNHVDIQVHNDGCAVFKELTSNRGNVLFYVDGGKLSVGKSCFFNTGTSVTCLNSIAIGERCTFGNNVVIVDHDHNYKKGSGFVTSPVVIGKGVWVGANCVILRGAEIGDNCIVAAGTVVRRGVYPSNTLIRADIQICKAPFVEN